LKLALERRPSESYILFSGNCLFGKNFNL